MMANLLKLIKLRCPEGIPTVKLSDIATISRGTRVVKDQLADEGLYPVYQNSLMPLGYYEKSNCPANTAFVIAAAAAGEIGFSNVDFWAADDCYFIEQCSSLNNRYLFHVLLSQKGKILAQVRRAGIPRLPRTALENLVIPLPPHEVQEEIVRILDEYSEKNAQLIDALKAELEARKVQYEHYQKSLFSFEKMSLSGPVELMTIGDIGKISMCKRVMKAQTSSDGDIPFYKIGTFGRTADAYISQELFEEYRDKYSYPNTGDILISASGTIGRTVIFDGKPAYFQDSNIVWVANDESKVTNTYLRMYYHTKPWKPREGGTITRLYNDIIESTPIAVPSIEDQEKIVKKFEQLEATFAEYSEALEKEMQLRQMQYEYYRDKLLTFKEAT